ncbi:hypothetical protein IB238_09620 [Rhizobium sp. ARZ01]|uniref:hypothetical protein n=1 Tax=Rhizobium sp. ARZ01 TaxID=2769313 RepID=UPI00177F3F01|nr:hypothetical protein [Rhizobium sp. ARZ01]MBD9372874.1 hypothetical protein [Rhizobium sp. ARZ01]
MKPFRALSSTLVACAISGPAFASAMIQGMQVPVPTPRPAVVELAQTDGTSTSEKIVKPHAGETQPDTMTTGAISPAASLGDLKAVDVSKISVMRVDEISDANRREMYRLSTEKKAVEVRKLQADIRSNPELVAALDAKQVDIEKIVAVHQSAEGHAIFIVM